MIENFVEIKRMIIKAGIIYILAVMPLYMTTNGYYMLADSKYYFLRNGSVFLMILFFSVSLTGFLYRLFREKRAYLKTIPGSIAEFFKKFSLLDKIVVIFYIFLTVSFMFSRNKDITFAGNSEWHMGYFTYLVLLFFYFAIRKYYRYERIDRYIFMGIFISVFVVFFIAFLNRFGIDIINVFKNYDYFSWEIRNKLSTIGNIDWFMCYASVMLPFMICCFIFSKKYFKIITFIALYICFVTTFICGCNVSFIVLAACILFFMVLSTVRKEYINVFLELLGIIPTFMLYLSIFPNYTMFNDDFQAVSDRTRSVPAWLIVCICYFLLFGIIHFFMYYKESKKAYKIYKYSVIGFLSVIALSLITLTILSNCSGVFSDTFAASFLRFSDEWGSMRGKIWKESIRQYLGNDIKSILLGVGQDDYYNFYAPGIIYSGFWEDAVIYNAHNEFLNMILNVGALGGLSYILIYFFAIKKGIEKITKSRTSIFLVLIPLCYFITGFFMFDQIISTPMVVIFVALFSKECDNI